jgi:hypothetical protein
LSEDLKGKRGIMKKVGNALAGLVKAHRNSGDLEPPKGETPDSAKEPPRVKALHVTQSQAAPVVSAQRPSPSEWTQRHETLPPRRPSVAATQGQAGARPALQPDDRVAYCGSYLGMYMIAEAADLRFEKTSADGQLTLCTAAKLEHAQLANKRLGPEQHAAWGVGPERVYYVFDSKDIGRR